MLLYLMNVLFFSVNMPVYYAYLLSPDFETNFILFSVQFSCSVVPDSL